MYANCLKRILDFFCALAAICCLSPLLVFLMVVGAYKMKGKSAIPDGSYAVVISYSPKFQEWLPLLLGGPEFNRKWQGVRIHAGNSAKDTEGCILVGENREVGRVLDSRRTLARLMKRLAERPEGEAVRLRIES